MQKPKANMPDNTRRILNTHVDAAWLLQVAVECSSSSVCVRVYVLTYVCACVCNLKCANCLYLRRQRKQFCERATLLAARVSFVCRTLNKINEGFVYGSCAVSANRPAACCGNVWHGRRMLLRQLLLLLLSLLRLFLQASTAPATASAAATTFCWQLSACTADTAKNKKKIFQWWFFG